MSYDMARYSRTTWECIVVQHEICNRTTWEYIVVRHESEIENYY